MVLARKKEPLFDRTIRHRTMDLSKVRQSTGLWADGPTSYFDNSRKMRTIDPSEVEEDLGLSGRQGTAWCTSLEKTGGSA